MLRALAESAPPIKYKRFFISQDQGGWTTRQTEAPHPLPTRITGTEIWRRGEKIFGERDCDSREQQRGAERHNCQDSENPDL